MSSFSSSLLLVWVQVSVSSSWRLAQTANTETNAITVARTTNASAARAVPSRLPESVSVSFMGLSRSRPAQSMSRPEVGHTAAPQMWEGAGA